MASFLLPFYVEIPSSKSLHDVKTAFLFLIVRLFLIKFVIKFKFEACIRLNHKRRFFVYLQASFREKS
jgi:hypothetical protein